MLILTVETRDEASKLEILRAKPGREESWRRKQRNHRCVWQLTEAACLRNDVTGGAGVGWIGRMRGNVVLGQGLGPDWKGVGGIRVWL